MPRDGVLQHALLYGDDWWFVYWRSTNKKPGIQNFKIIADEVKGPANHWLGMKKSTLFVTKNRGLPGAIETWGEMLFEYVQQSMRALTAEPLHDTILVRLLDTGVDIELPAGTVPRYAAFGTQVRDAIKRELAIF